MNSKLKMALKITAWVVIPLAVSIPVYAGIKIYKKNKNKIKENPESNSGTQNTNISAPDISDRFKEGEWKEDGSYHFLWEGHNISFNPFTTNSGRIEGSGINLLMRRHSEGNNEIHGIYFIQQDKNTVQEIGNSKIVLR
jgi:hypothetical protein